MSTLNYDLSNFPTSHSKVLSKVDRPETAYTIVQRTLNLGLYSSEATVSIVNNLTGDVVLNKRKASKVNVKDIIANDNVITESRFQNTIAGIVYPFKKSLGCTNSQNRNVYTVRIEYQQ